MEPRHAVHRLLPFLLLAAGGCGYSYYAEAMKPLEQQAPALEVHDDGSVVYTRGRLEVRARPVTEEELNRRFESMSQEGRRSINPYTFANAKRPAHEGGAGRFTVFHLSVKNYEYPKVEFDPAQIALFADNGREYWALNMLQLTTYFRAYAVGYGGNEYRRYRERTDLLNQTLYKKQMIFSGQEADGYLVFRTLHPDVEDLTLTIHDAVTRFDYREEPLETIDISYRFGRETGKVWPSYWSRQKVSEK